jgi:hypothetical protein
VLPSPLFDRNAPSPTPFCLQGLQCVDLVYEEMQRVSFECEGCVRVCVLIDTPASPSLPPLLF